MEAAREDMGPLDKIRPPRLDDAGLEDCALPPESIKEAFLKAASAVGLRCAASILAPADADEDDDGCLDDPFPTGSGRSDALVGITSEADPPGSCFSAEKEDPLSGVDDAAADLVGGRNEEEEKGKQDEIVVAGLESEEGGVGGCVDPLRGLKIGEKGGRK
ncbi:hypothetical protein Dimus_027743 [Dionaea muscipula]